MQYRVLVELSLYPLFPKLYQFFSRQIDRLSLHISRFFTLCFDNTLNVELTKRDFFIEEIAEVAIVMRCFVPSLEHFLLAHFTSVLHAEGVQASDLLVVKSQLASAILHTKFGNSSLGVEKLSLSLGFVLIFRKISYSTTMEICYRWIVTKTF